MPGREERTSRQAPPTWTWRQSWAMTTAATVMEKRTASGAAVVTGRSEGEQRHGHERFAEAERRADQRGEEDDGGGQEKDPIHDKPFLPSPTACGPDSGS